LITRIWPGSIKITFWHRGSTACHGKKERNTHDFPSFLAGLVTLDFLCRVEDLLPQSRAPDGGKGEADASIYSDGTSNGKVPQGDRRLHEACHRCAHLPPSSSTSQKIPCQLEILLYHHFIAGLALDLVYG
jgi:hypothetical protein